jgi:hypothetical protein
VVARGQKLNDVAIEHATLPAEKSIAGRSAKPFLAVCHVRQLLHGGQLKRV